MFRNFCVVFLAALTTFILLLTFYIARSDLSLRLILFSAGDVLYIKNILPVVAARHTAFCRSVRINIFYRQKTSCPHCFVFLVFPVLFCSVHRFRNGLFTGNAA